MLASASFPVIYSGGEEVRVQYALGPVGEGAPELGSLSWVVFGGAPTADLPVTFHTPKLPIGMRVWLRASGWTDGQRVTNYSTPQFVDIGDAPRLLSWDLRLEGGAPRVRWTPNALTQGIRLRWAVHVPADAPELLEQLDREASDLSVQLPATVPVRRAITVELEAWSGWSAGQVDGDLGHVVRRTTGRPRGPGDDLGCRLIFTSSLELVVTSDLCLVTSETP